MGFQEKFAMTPRKLPAFKHRWRWPNPANNSGTKLTPARRAAQTRRRLAGFSRRRISGLPFQPVKRRAGRHVAKIIKLSVALITPLVAAVLVVMSTQTAGIRLVARSRM